MNEEMIDLGRSRNSTEADAIASLHRVLMNPDVTAELIEAFSETEMGYSAWSRILSLPTYALKGAKFSAIKRSVSAFLASEHNSFIKEQLGEWDVLQLIDSRLGLEISNLTEEQFNLWVNAEKDTFGLYCLLYSRNAMINIASNPSKFNKVLSSAWTTNAIVASPVALHVIFANADTAQQVVRSSTIMSLIATNELAMDHIAKDTSALAAIFGEMSARTILWDAGKMPADKLMRESEISRQWLLENVAIVRVGAHTTTYDNNKKSYLLNTNTKYEQTYIIGRFAGDHTQTEIYTQGGSIDFNERLLSLRQIDNDNSVPSTATYIEME
ncbi:hypothetical protein [Vibrio diabolicus]|uniref:hypothetical protein n=1 Tax=Vibrio diabolicus TaxID=50719 RepID=UPI00232E69AA|nr:hypothetical protein [Vibrio diabolicus]